MLMVYESKVAAALLDLSEPYLSTVQRTRDIKSMSIISIR